MTPSLHTVFFSPTGSSRRIAQETARVLEQELAQNMALARDDDWTGPFLKGGRQPARLGRRMCCFLPFRSMPGEFPKC